MEQLTLEQAAISQSHVASFEHAKLKRSPQEIHCIAFEAGAEWQKEQYKRLIQLSREAANTCADEGNYLTATAIYMELERLKD